MSLPKTAPILFRLPASWETEINFQSRYPGGIFVTKRGTAESSACRVGGAVSAIIPASIPIATSSKVIRFMVVPLKSVYRSERLNIEAPVQECSGVRKEAPEDRILPMSVEMLLRFVALVGEPQGGIGRGSVPIVDHYSGTRTGSVARSAKHHSSPMPVIGENVISRLHYRVAREPALGVVPLRRFARQGAGRERIGRSVIVEPGVSPPAAVGEPLAALHHEVHVMLG